MCKCTHIWLENRLVNFWVAPPWQKTELGPSEVVTDSCVQVGESLQELKEKTLDVYIPIMHNRTHIYVCVTGVVRQVLEGDLCFHPVTSDYIYLIQAFPYAEAGWDPEGHESAGCGVRSLNP